MTDTNNHPDITNSNSDGAPKVTGIGGVFFFSENPEMILKLSTTENSYTLWMRKAFNNSILT